MFLFLSFVFFFYKIGEQEGGTGFAQSGGRLALVGGERWWGKGRRVNMVQTVYSHVCKCKNDSC
jgi:hypothetical protein